MYSELIPSIQLHIGETSNGDTEDTEPVVNPEEIDIDEDEDDNDEDVQVEQQSVPSKVFGGLRQEDD
ncbi:hypothetical protein OS493_024809 [Desmophyllum pertusum]|uniref:Uncharacterized protein n=1 Tax=Desmophyllum pertusum TaxID=174260 RepID=A0A9W9ZDF8_9CNID|nr:hypothetical protein OS493_024809 [Desmophyllum pertusum]